MNSIIERIRSDERGLSALEWIGVVTAVLVLAMLVPQIRSALDVMYENLVGKNNVGPDGEPRSSTTRTSDANWRS